MHQKGFVSLLGTGICHINGGFEGKLGKNLEVGHAMGSLWCAANKMYDYDQSLQK